MNATWSSVLASRFVPRPILATSASPTLTDLSCTIFTLTDYRVQAFPVPREFGRLGARETCLVGEDDGLHAIPQVELVENVRDMSLDRRLGDMQARGDLCVGEPPRDLCQHVA